MKKRSVLVLGVGLWLASASVFSQALFDRIVNPGFDEERLPIGPLFASFREVADGAPGANLNDIKTQFNLTQEERDDLDRLVAMYLSVPNTDNNRAKWLAVLADVFQLAEYQVPDWYDTIGEAWGRIQQKTTEIGGDAGASVRRR